MFPSSSIHNQMSHLIPISPLLLVKEAQGYPLDVFLSELEETAHTEDLLAEELSNFHEANKRLFIPHDLFSSLLAESKKCITSPASALEESKLSLFLQLEFKFPTIDTLERRKYLFSVAGVGHTELWAIRIEDQSLFVDKMLRTPTKEFIINPLLIPRIGLMESRFPDFYSPKAMIIWKEKAQPIRQICATSSFLGIRTSYSIEIFSIPTEIQKWNSTSWWKDNAKITPPLVSEYFVEKFRQDHHLAILSLKLSPKDTGEFAVLFSDLTLLESLFRESEQVLHTYNLSHLSLLSSLSHTQKIISFEYVAKGGTGRFIIVIDDMVFLLTSEVNAQLLGKITPGIAFISPLMISEFPTIVVFDKKSHRLSLYQRDSNYEYNMIHSWPCLWEMVDETNCSKLTTPGEANFACRWFDFDANQFGFVMWETKSQKAYVFIIGKNPCSFLQKRNLIQIPTVRTLHWGFRNKTTSPFSAANSKQDAFLVDVLPIVGTESQATDVHFLQFYSDQKIYGISYRANPAPIFTELQKNISLVPRATFEIPRERIKNWSSRLTFRPCVFNRRSHQSTISLLPLFKLFLLSFIEAEVGEEKLSLSPYKILLEFPNDQIKNLIIQSVAVDLNSILKDLTQPSSLSQIELLLLHSQVKKNLHLFKEKQLSYFLLVSLLNKKLPKLILEKSMRIKTRSPNLQFIRVEPKYHFPDKKTNILEKTSFLECIGIGDYKENKFPFPFAEQCIDDSSNARSFSAVSRRVSNSMKFLQLGAHDCCCCDSESIALSGAIDKDLCGSIYLSKNLSSDIEQLLSNLWDFQRGRSTLFVGSSPTCTFFADPVLNDIQNLFGRHFSTSNSATMQRDFTTESITLSQPLGVDYYERMSKSQTPLIFSSQQAPKNPASKPAIIKKSKKFGFR